MIRCVPWQEYTLAKKWRKRGVHRGERNNDLETGS